MIPEKFIAVLLYGVGDELQKQFGPDHRMTAEDVKDFAKRYVERFHLPSQDEILTALNAEIEAAAGWQAGGVG
jgi:hypothetical protein